MHDEHLNIRGLKAAGKCVDCRVSDLYVWINNKTWIKLGFTYGDLFCVKKLDQALLVMSDPLHWKD